MKGGAEKQSILLANVLSENHKVHFISLKGNNIEPSLLKWLWSKKIVLIKLKKNLICDCIRIYKVFKQNFSTLQRAKEVIIGQRTKEVVQQTWDGKVPKQPYPWNSARKAGEDLSGGTIAAVTQETYESNVTEIEVAEIFSAAGIS